MFKVQSIALTAVLFGLHAKTASAAGCYPGWVSGQSYTADSTVSASITSTTAVVTTSCTVGDSGCDADGYARTGGVTSVGTYNLKCSGIAAFCGQINPSDPVYGDDYWTQESAVCSGTVTVAETIPTAWTEGGCPAAYVGGTDYDAEATVAVTMGTYSMVYQCTSVPNNLFCGKSGYEPGTGQYWAQAWTELGSCTGTIAPTGSPVNVVLGDVGGCPGGYEASADYEEGDKVAENGLVYQCKGWPQSAHCSQVGYEPGTSVGSGGVVLEAWTNAWNVVGHCEGEMEPTSSPSYVSLTLMGGCPQSWAAKSGSEAYEEGDKVESNGLVFQCKAWPFSGWCGQDGYEPLINGATSNSWSDAWTLAGYCDGLMGPTSSPTFDSLASVGACPQDWVAGDVDAYEADDEVSVSVSTAPIRKVVYKCKSWPNSNYCGQHAPDVYGGDLGWTLAGSCDGSIGPTASPNFEDLSFISDPSGCPGDFATSSTYEAGDLVSLTVSLLPERKVVYECRAWPNVGYCNQQGTSLDPGQEYGYLGWTLKGACTGTLAPTGAPTPYDNSANTCTYIKCAAATSCTAGAAATNAISGSTACSCGSGATQSSSCKQVTCTDTDVDLYSSSTTYATGDISRLSNQKFTCKVAGWCNQSGYQPKMEAGIWSQAWTKSGTCPVP